MENGGRNGMENGGRNGMENGGRIERYGKWAHLMGLEMVWKMRVEMVEVYPRSDSKNKVGLVLSDTLSTPIGGQKTTGGKIPGKLNQKKLKKRG